LTTKNVETYTASAVNVRMIYLCGEYNLFNFYLNNYNNINTDINSLKRQLLFYI